MSAAETVTFFARTNFRNQQRLFGVRRSDRLSHFYVIGKTGTGKSTLLETLMRQDLENGEGFAFLDPHGDLIEKILLAVPTERQPDVVYFNATDRSNLVGLNPLRSVPPEKRPVAASGLLEAFKKIWADSWGPRMEHILRNTLLALLDQPEATLADVPRLLESPEFRREAMHRVANPQVRHFWLREFDKYPSRFRLEAIAPIQNKVGAFLANPILNAILTEQRNMVDLRAIMDEGKILLVNLSKGRIGEDAAMLLGSLLVSQISLAALCRAGTAAPGRTPFFLYLDEFQNFTTRSLANMLSELRKYGIGLVLAHQYLSQLDLQVRDAILGNAGTVVCFRVGMADAEILAKDLYPTFSAEDLVALPNHHIYLRLMIDGRVSEPFSAETIGP